METIKQPEFITGYHFSPGWLRFNDKLRIVENTVHSIPSNKEIWLCVSGFHCSPEPLQAYRFYGKYLDVENDTLYLSRVTLLGDVQIYINKSVGRHRYYNKVVRLTREQRRILRRLYKSDKVDEFNTYAKRILS